MLGEVRQSKLVDLLLKEKSVTIRELSDLFQVSEETIRRDLKKLEKNGLVAIVATGGIGSKQGLTTSSSFET